MNESYHPGSKPLLHPKSLSNIFPTVTLTCIAAAGAHLGAHHARRLMDSVTVHLDGRIAHELDALKAETMISSNLLLTNACENAKKEKLDW